MEQYLLVNDVKKSGVKNDVNGEIYVMIQKLYRLLWVGLGLKCEHCCGLNLGYSVVLLMTFQMEQD